MTDEHLVPELPSPEGEDSQAIYLTPEEQRADDQPPRWYGDADFDALHSLRGGSANSNDVVGNDVTAIKEQLKDPDVPATTSETARSNFIELTEDEKDGHPPSRWPRLVREKQEKLRLEHEEAAKQDLIEKALEAREKREEAARDSDLGIPA